LPKARAGLEWGVMKQIDLDDLPPRAAQILAGLAAGEPLLLVQNGLVMGRLTGGGAEPGVDADAAAGPPPAGEARAAEIFEHFRSLMEDDF
jgi:hypothetical protein